MKIHFMATYYQEYCVMKIYFMATYYQKYCVMKIYFMAKYYLPNNKTPTHPLKTTNE